MAVALANMYTMGAYHLVTDCSSAYSSATKGAGYAIHWSRPMGGMWQDVRFEHIHAHKTKAHRSKQQAVLSGDLEEWTGNAVVDDLAKEAAAMGGPSSETIASRDVDVSNRVAYYHYVAKLLKMWAPAHPVPHKAKAAKAIKAIQLHVLEWLPFVHTWGCTQARESSKPEQPVTSSHARAFHRQPLTRSKQPKTMGTGSWCAITCRHRGPSSSVTVVAVIRKFG